MEPEDRGTGPPGPEEDDPFNPLGRALIALVLGIAMVLILNIFNRGGWFALLSAFFSILLYVILVIVQELRNSRGSQPHPSPNPQEKVTRQAVMAILSRGLPLAGLQAIVGFVGLFLLPDQKDLIFAVISGVFGFLLCKGLFTVGMLAVILFLASRERIGSSGEG